MRRKYGHVPKTPSERSEYSQYIRKKHDDPTVDEGLDFAESIDKQQDLSVPTAGKPRKRPIGNVLKEHFQENWTNWLAGCFAVILMFVMVQYRIDLARIFEKLDFMNEDINALESSNSELENAIHEQNLKIQQNSINLQHLENKGFPNHLQARDPEQTPPPSGK